VQFSFVSAAQASKQMNHSTRMLQALFSLYFLDVSDEVYGQVKSEEKC